MKKEDTTEERWLVEGRRHELFELVSGSGSHRKCRLLIAACARLLGQEEVARVSEQVADGLLPTEDLQIVRHRPWVVRFLRHPRRYAPTRVPPSDQVREFVWQALQPDARFGVTAVLDLGRELLPADFAPLVREIFGGAGAGVEPRWLTSNVVDVARTIYEGRPRQAGGYIGMPILADALLDAGCDDEAIIDHCRSDGPHVKGCWAVDLTLGKG